MWGVFEWAVLGERGSLNFDKEYLFCFETTASGILSMHNQLVTSFDPFNKYLKIREMENVSI